MKGPAHYLTSPSLYPSGPGRFISLRTKFVVFFSLIIILTCSGMSWYFIHSKRIAMTERVQDLGTILVKNLAHNVRYGIIIQERVIHRRRRPDPRRKEQRQTRQSARDRPIGRTTFLSAS